MNGTYKVLIAAGWIISIFLTSVLAEGAEPRTNGYFSSKYGRLEIVGATASFSATDEESTNYSLAVEFCYKPMTEADIAAMKAAGGIWGIPIERRRSLRVAEYPSYAPNVFITLGEWHIGQPPPSNSTNIDGIHVTSNGSRGRRIIPGSQSARVVQWSATPEGKQFVLKGRVAGKRQYDADDLWEWDISFEARTVNWSVGKYGLGDIPATPPATNALPSQPK